jgi:hypothetical protein
MNEGVSSHSAAHGGEAEVLDIREHPNRSQTPPLQIGYRRSMQNQDENGKRSADRFFSLCMICVDNRQKGRNCDVHATMNLIRLLTQELDAEEKPVY